MSREWINRYYLMGPTLVVFSTTIISPEITHNLKIHVELSLLIPVIILNSIFYCFHFLRFLLLVILDLMSLSLKFLSFSLRMDTNVFFRSKVEV